MTKVVSFFSSKGGAGKTASVLFAANALHDMGYSVLVLDMCSNGDIANNFEFDRESFYGHTTLDWIIGNRTIQEVAVQVRNKDIYFVPSDPKIQTLKDWTIKNIAKGRNEILKRKLEGIEGIFDFVLLDLHPAQLDFASTISLVSSPYVFIPFQLDGNNRDGAKQAAKVVKDLKNKGYKMEYLIVPIAIRTFNFGKDKKLVKKVYKQFEDLGYINLSEEYVTHCDYLGEWTLGFRSFEDILKEKSTKKVLEQYKKIMTQFLEIDKMGVKS